MRVREIFERFLAQRNAGRGVWKWEHYLDAYARHLSKFRNQAAVLLEIGVYSGGSLDMWRDYLGPKAQIVGVDIEPACKAYEAPGIRIYIGDQGDARFWKRVKKSEPVLDIVVDDGGHLPIQQQVTFEALWPHLRPGGVYVCEDIHGDPNAFASYVHALSHRFNASDGIKESHDDPANRLVTKTNSLQAEMRSMTLYPYLAVFEKNPAPVDQLRAPKRGSEWQPHLR